jgi:hypothetical protein
VRWDDPFELNVVVIDIVLPLVAPLRYGLPLASVTDILPPLPPPPPETQRKYQLYRSESKDARRIFDHRVA